MSLPAVCLPSWLYGRTDKGQTLFDLLDEIYLKYGYADKGLNLVRQGREGAEEIAKMMSDYRSQPPKTIAGSPIVKIKDFLSLEEKDCKTGESATNRYANYEQCASILCSRWLGTLGTP